MKKLPFLRTLGNTLKNTFKELYGHMGFSFLISIVWYIAYLPIIIFGGSLVQYFASTKTHQPGEFYTMLLWFCVVAGVWSTLLAGPVTTSLYMLFQSKDEEYPTVKLFWSYFKKIFRRSAAIHGLFFICVTLLVFNLMISQLNNNILLIISGIFSLYFLIYLQMMSIYFHPLVHLDNSLKKIIKKSFLLVMDNFALSIVFTFILEILLLLGYLIPPIAVLLFFFYGAFQVYLINNGFAFIYAKYD